jgi:hypothetical protein
MMKTPSASCRALSKSSLLALIVAIALLPACGTDNPVAPTPGVDLAVISLSVDPNPITATNSAAAGFTYTATFTVVIQETSGVGGTVQEVRSTLFDPVTGLTIAVNSYDDKDLIVFAGTSRLAPKGTLNVSQVLNYTVTSDNLSRAANLTVFIQVKDDHSNVLTQSMLVKVI